MTLYDRFGAPVSHGNRADIDMFGDAVELMLAYAPDPVTTISELLERAPDFIMARCFLAGIYLIASDKRRQLLMRRHLDELVRRIDAANDRERAHIAAIGLWAEGDFYASSQAYADILGDWPRDIVALQIGHQTDFLLGHASSTRDRPARAMPYWSEDDPQYSYVLGMQAFGLEEAGHYREAQALAERSVALNAKDAWGVHALAHCLEMQGKADEGIAFMTAREEKWGRDNYMAIHNRWHLSLYHLERCEFDQALALHDRYMAVTPASELMDAHDSAAMLWRLMLDGVDVGRRWEPVADIYANVLDQAYMPFTDIHAMMAFSATGRSDEAAEQLKALEAGTRQNTTSAEVIRIAGLPLVRGFHAFGRGDYSAARNWLSRARHNSHMIGGSVAQRDVINLTLLEACNRSGERAMAEALLNERVLLRPHSPLIDLFRSRLH